MPRGPREVLRVLPSEAQAMILDWVVGGRAYLVCLEALGALLALLVAEEDEGPPVLVEDEAHSRTTIF